MVKALPAKQGQRGFDSLHQLMRIDCTEMLVTFGDGEEFSLVRCGPVDKTDEWDLKDSFSGYYWKIYGRSRQITLSRDLTWEYEPMPSSRTEEYIAATRHRYSNAIKLIKKWKEEHP
jgi:hypothetical protein